MSKLRDQLQIARSVHQSMQYPGDLAADLALRQRADFWLKSRSYAAAVAAVAAMIVLALFVNHWTLTDPTPGITQLDTKPSTDAVAEAPMELTVPGLPTMPTLEGISLFPSTEVGLTLPAMPSFPSLDDETSPQGATTQQSEG